MTAAVCRSSTEAGSTSRPLLELLPLFWTMDSWEPGAYPQDQDDDSGGDGPSGVLEQLRKLHALRVMIPRYLPLSLGISGPAASTAPRNSTGR